MALVAAMLVTSAYPADTMMVCQKASKASLFQHLNGVDEYNSQQTDRWSARRAIWLQ